MSIQPTAPNPARASGRPPEPAAPTREALTLAARAPTAPAQARWRALGTSVHLAAA